MSETEETKSAPLGLRIRPSLKAALEQAAEAEHRTVASLCEMILTDWIVRRNAGAHLPIGEQRAWELPVEHYLDPDEPMPTFLSWVNQNHNPNNAQYFLPTSHFLKPSNELQKRIEALEALMRQVIEQHGDGKVEANLPEPKVPTEHELEGLRKKAYQAMSSAEDHSNYLKSLEDDYAKGTAGRLDRGILSVMQQLKASQIDPDALLAVIEILERSTLMAKGAFPKHVTFQVGRRKVPKSESRAPAKRP